MVKPDIDFILNKVDKYLLVLIFYLIYMYKIYFILVAKTLTGSNRRGLCGRKNGQKFFKNLFKLD